MRIVMRLTAALSCAPYVRRTTTAGAVPCRCCGRHQNDDGSRQPDLAGQQRGDTDRAGAFDDLLLGIGVPDAGGDLYFRQEHDVVQQVAAHPNVRRLARPMPPPSESASVGTSSTWTGLPAARLAFIAAPRCHGNADYFRAGLSAFHRSAIPEVRPPPESGTRMSPLPARPRYLQPERSLSGNHGRMVERGYRHPLRRHQPVDLALRVVLDWPTIRISAPSLPIASTLFRHERRHADDAAHPAALAACASARP